MDNLLISLEDCNVLLELRNGIPTRLSENSFLTHVADKLIWASGKCLWHYFGDFIWSVTD